MIEATLGTTESTRRALDIACGLGHNAIWLAQQGWQADAVDVSTTGLELARQSADANKVHVSWIEADLDNLPADTVLAELSGPGERDMDRGGIGGRVAIDSPRQPVWRSGLDHGHRRAPSWTTG